MAFSKLERTKAGKEYYLIRCRVSRDAPEKKTRWYVPEGWSQRTIERELKKQEADFERKCRSGEIVTRKERKQAEEERAAAEAAILTVQKYFETVFLPAKEATITETSRNSFVGIYTHQILPYIGQKKITEVTPADVMALLVKLQKKYAHATCVKTYCFMNLLFKMAERTGVIDRNPMQKIDRPKKRKDEVTKTDVLTVEDVWTLITFMQGEPLKWRCLVQILIDTGMRRGECHGLQWADIDFDKGTATIARSLNYTPAKGVYVGTPKTGKTRVVDLPASTVALLRMLRREQASSCLSKWVFTQDGSPEPMNPTNSGHYLQIVRKKLNLPQLHPHTLRHTFASLAIQNGADVASVAGILGHADVATTLRVYAHSSEASRKKAASIFQDALSRAETASK